MVSIVVKHVAQQNAYCATDMFNVPNLMVQNIFISACEARTVFLNPTFQLKVRVSGRDSAADNDDLLPFAFKRHGQHCSETHCATECALSYGFA